MRKLSCGRSIGPSSRKLVRLRALAAVLPLVPAMSTGETSLAPTALLATLPCRAIADKRKIEGMVRKGAKTADETHDPDEVCQLQPHLQLAGAKLRERASGFCVGRRPPLALRARP